MNSVRRALVFSMAERYALIAISLLSNILIARLLTPEEIGIYSVSLAVIGIAHVLRDFGIGSFLIQEKDLKDEHIQTAFGISLLIGTVLFLIVYFSASFVGQYYNEMHMMDTLRIVSINFLILPFCTISMALLRRGMAFNKLIKVSLVAALASFFVAVGLAYSGFGPNSMAIGSVVGNVATGMGAWVARPERRLMWPSFSKWRSLLKFGGQSSLSGVVTSISMNANDLVVGKMLGFNQVAIFSRAQGLMSLFHRDLMGAIQAVALPSFAASHRDGSDVHPKFIHSVAIITVFAWPFYGFVSIYALETLHFLYGPQWDAAAPLVPLLCLSGAISAVVSLIPTILVSIGRIGIVTQAELLLQPTRLALIIFAAIIYKSIIACAIAYMLSSVIALPVFLWCKSRALPGHNKLLMKNLFSSGAVSAITLMPGIIHIYFFGVSRTEPIYFPEVVAVCLAGSILWIISARWLRHPISFEPLFRKFFVSRFFPRERNCEQD